MKIIFDTKNKNIINIQLKEGGRVIDETDLTISQDLDNMLIRTIDKVLSRNKIERLSVKTAEILGKMEDEALQRFQLSATRLRRSRLEPSPISAMILKTVRTAVEI